MSQILEDWILSRLGIQVNFDHAGIHFFDGRLFFNILQSYNLVGLEVKKHFQRARTPQEALHNLNLLKVCFKLLGVLQDEKLLENIARKNGAACIELLNDLYLRLSNRHVLPIVSKEKEQQILNNDTGRFKKTRVFEKKCKLPENKRPEEKLLSRLQYSVKMFSYDKKTLCDKAEMGISQSLKDTSEKTKEEIKRGVEECKCGTTIEECLRKFDEKVSDLQAMGDYEQKRICPPDEYVKMLKLRTLKQAADKETEAKLKDIISKRLWCKQVKEREEELQCSFAEKLLKQSEFEREMAQRLGRIHLQYRVINEHRRQVHEEASQIYNERMETVWWRQESKPDLKKQNEKMRLFELHRKIYDSKIAQGREERTAMIEKIVSDLIDFSIKISEFQDQNMMAVPPRELNNWKALFYKNMPLLEKSDHTRPLADESSVSESFDSYIDRDGTIERVLNEQDFNEYMIMLGPWAKELWSDLENVEEELDVLGFVVHRLLEYKYPFPMPPEPMEVPNFPVKVILNNFVDEKALKILRNLMVKPKIEIIDIPSLIIVCIGHYKKEMGIEEEIKKDKKQKDKKTTDKPEKKKKKSIVKEPLFKSVEIQFPSLTDLEPPPPTLSEFAKLGKLASEILGTGSSLPDDVVVSIIVEYLKILEDREGWVLVNFPLDCKQVHQLEFIFTGMKPPFICDLLEENEKRKIKDQSDNGSDEFLDMEEYSKDDETVEDSSDDEGKLGELRTSKLLPRPNPSPPKYEFQTYFTRFIQIEHEGSTAYDLTENNKQEEKKGSKRALKRVSKSGEESKKTLEAENPINSENNQTPNTFYEKTDVYLRFPYTKLDLSTLKQIGRAILKETDEPGLERVPSVELFGEIAKEKKKRSSKITKKSATAKKKAISESSIKEVEIQEEQEEEITETSIKESIPCMVGDLCWEYTTLDIADELSLVLASFWESIELSYIRNFMDLFTFYREHDTQVVPYRNYIFKLLNTVMEEDDDRQSLVTNFQDELNDVVDTLRGNGEVKKELFCKIFELQLKLWESCDTKKNSCEEKRKFIIKENWIPKHVCGMFNLYVSMMETELDRYIDSIKLLQEYYLSCLGKAPPSQSMDKWYLPRYKLSDFESTKEEYLQGEGSASTTLKESTVVKQPAKSSLVKRFISLPLLADGVCETFNEILTNIDFDRNKDNPFWENMTKLTHMICDEISVASNLQMITIEKEKKSIFQKTAPDKSKSRKSIVGKDRSSKSTLAQEDARALQELEENSRKDNFAKALTEWSKAVQSETDRTIFRIFLIKNRFGNDLEELLDLMTETFHSLYNEISTRYFHQTKLCDALLKVLMAAVETENTIQPRLILKLDSFFVEDKQNESSSLIPTPPVTPIVETDDDFVFTVQQLGRFAEKMTMSPLGVSVEALIAIIEDLALEGRENGYPYLPKCWSLMTRSDIRKIIRSIFGDVVIADWKDLLIFGLNFRFPTVQEIIETRNAFLTIDTDRTETVNLEEYNSIVLWFEKEFCENLSGDLRVVLGKKFLFDLYKVGPDEMNYTAFLLNYCKDDYAVEGFGKALALAEGLGYVMKEEKLFLLDSAYRKTEAQLVVDQIINILLMDTLNWAEGIVITEVDDDGNTIKDYEEEFVRDDFGFVYAEKLLDNPVDKENIQDQSSNRASQSKEKFQSPSQKSVARNESIKSLLNTEAKQEDINEGSSSLENEKRQEEFTSAEDNVVWKSWTNRQFVLSLLMTCFQCYAYPEDKGALQIEMEEALLSLFRENGVNDCIQAYQLVQCPYFQDLLEKSFKFKTCNLTQLIKNYTQSKNPRQASLF